MERSSRKSEQARPAPTQNDLHEAALAYLTHRSSSVAQMQKVLARRIAAWARRASASAETDVEGGVARAEAAAALVVERLVASGLLNDAVYAKTRAEYLTRAGKSRRAVAFDLKVKGVRENDARAAVPQDADTELAAAVALMRKKRMGPYAREAPDEPDDKVRRRWLGAFARGGFSFATAQRVLRMDRDSADALLRNFR